MAALTLLTPPAQATIPGTGRKMGTPETVSTGAQSRAPGRAWSSAGMANCSPIFMSGPPQGSSGRRLPHLPQKVKPLPKRAPQ